MKYLQCVLAILLFTQSLFGERSWELWDKNHVSNTIDTYWLSSPEEMEHRNTLAKLTQAWLLPNDRFLEIGCGSGLVYNSLVPAILSNHAYTGVDISEKMLAIASKRFPEGVFMKDDLYGLSFPDNSFEVVAAFEVFGHIDEIETPIREMFRTTSRTMIFTVWTGPQTKMEQEIIDNIVFRHKTFANADVVKSVERALEGTNYKLQTETLPGGKMAYIIQK